MNKNINPVTKIGTLHIKPCWRWELLQNPAKYKMQGFVSQPPSGASCLKRFLGLGLEYTVNTTMPSYIKEYVNEIDPSLTESFQGLWNRFLKRTNQKKINVTTNVGLFRKNPVWNIAEVSQIKDNFLKRLIYHHSNYRYDAAIQKAVELFVSPDHQEIFKFLGYGMYAKISDKRLACHYNLTVKQVEAVRLLFFDFSKFPKDKVASFAYLRQLANIGVFSDVDFAYFKRIHEMGELGLRAQVDFHNLERKEKIKVQEFLGESIISNVLNVNFSIRSQKDAIQYGTLVTTLTDYHIKEKEAAFLDSRIRNLDVSTEKLTGSMKSNTDGLSDNDEKMLALLREYSLNDGDQPKYKTLDMLN